MSRNTVLICLVLVMVLGAVWWLLPDSSEEAVAPESVELPEALARAATSKESTEADVAGALAVPIEGAASMGAEAQNSETPDTGVGKVRKLIEGLRAVRDAGGWDETIYQAFLADVEDVAGAHPEEIAAIWALVQSELKTDPDDNSRAAWIANKMRDDLERKLGFVWGQVDPEQALRFGQQASDHLLAGWVASQIHLGTDYPKILQEAQVELSDDVYWEALLDIAETDAITSLDTILSNHMDEMNLDKWREILFSPGNSNDEVLAAWFQENYDQLSSSENFDEVEVVRMLRRFDSGEGSFMTSEDLAQIESIKADRNYEVTAAMFETMSQRYGGLIDASAVGFFAVDWARQDLAAASAWMMENADNFSDPASLESMMASAYRVSSYRDMEQAVQASLKIENEHYRGVAMSNVLIPQVEDSGAEAPVDWVRDLPQGFAKERTMAGYVLGLSRHAEEATLEAQVKFQFLQDDFDVDLISRQVLESKLPDNEKRVALELLKSY